MDKVRSKREREWSDLEDWTHLCQSLPPQGQQVNDKVTQPILDNRINFGVSRDDELRQCPYQKSHLILSNRWQRHLCKCRQNYVKECETKKVEVAILICKWNTSHHLPQSDMDQHQKVCPSRVNFDLLGSSHGQEVKSEPAAITVNLEFSDATQESLEGKLQQKSRKRLKLERKSDIKEPNRSDSEENWELEEGECPEVKVTFDLGYDPKKSILKRNIPFIPIPSGRPPLERQKFRQLQIARLRNEASADLPMSDSNKQESKER